MNDEIKAQFKEQMQNVYGNMLKRFGIPTGDIDPLTYVALEEKEDELANIVAAWIRSGIEL